MRFEVHTVTNMSIEVATPWILVCAYQHFGETASQSTSPQSTCEGDL